MSKHSKVQYQPRHLHPRYVIAQREPKVYFVHSRTVIGGFLLSFLVLCLTVIGAPRAGASAEPHNKVTLCHATPPATAKNGWVMISPNANSVIKEGHDGHSADIIPAFDYSDGHYPGKNLDTIFSGSTGAQILANECKLPDKEPSSPPPSTQPPTPTVTSTPSSTTTSPSSEPPVSTSPQTTSPSSSSTNPSSANPSSSSPTSAPPTSGSHTSKAVAPPPTSTTSTTPATSPRPAELASTGFGAQVGIGITVLVLIVGATLLILDRFLGKVRRH